VYCTPPVLIPSLLLLLNCVIRLFQRKVRILFKKEATSQLMNRWGISQTLTVIYLIAVGCFISEGVPYTTSAYYLYISWRLDFIPDTPCFDAGMRVSSIKTSHPNTDTMKE
jgi:hypothetical protein